jgi:hypothetical protein
MIELKVKELKPGELDKIILDAFNWLVESFGDRSIELNKLNYKKKYSTLKPYLFKHPLSVSWSKNPESLDWTYYGQFAEYNAVDNTIYILCKKNYTLEFVLDSLFHEYKHSQQNMTKYSYQTNILHTPYDKNPLELEAVEFAKDCLQKFIKIYPQKVAG